MEKKHVQIDLTKYKTTQRILAYLIDAFILSLVFSLLTFWIPTSDRYDKAVSKTDKLYEEYMNNEVNDDVFFNEYFDNLYIVEKEMFPQNLISIIMFVGYFGTFAFYNNGQTIGKKCMKIKVVSNNKKKLGHLKFVGRALIAYGILSSIISLVMLFLVKSNSYFYCVLPIQIISDSLTLVSLLLVIFSKDKRAIHDYLFGTKVISE